MEDLIKDKSCDKVTIPQERYEQLVALESRVKAAVDYISNTAFCDIVMTLRIMGAYEAAKKQEEKEKKLFDSEDAMNYTE